ncbi:MAG: hypothetical protein ACI9LN_003628, partial [Saprospiraceae bacterium]
TRTVFFEARKSCDFLASQLSKHANINSYYDFYFLSGQVIEGIQPYLLKHDKRKLKVCGTLD